MDKISGNAGRSVDYSFSGMKLRKSLCFNEIKKLCGKNKNEGEKQLTKLYLMSNKGIVGKHI